MKNPALNINTRREAGERIQQRLSERLNMAVLGLFLLAMGLGLSSSLQVSEWLGPQAVSLAGLGLLMTGTVIALSAQHATGRMAQGRHGEKLIAHALDHLVRDGATTFHGVMPKPAKIGDIDHILIHRSGIYVIETKMWNGRGKHAPRIVVRNDEVVSKFARPCHQARRGAKWLAEAYEKHSGQFHFVQPIVAMPGCEIVQPVPAKTPVLNGAALVKHIRSRPDRLKHQQMIDFARFVRSLA